LKRYALLGAAVGTLLALVLFAPAQWLGAVLARISDNRVQLAEARGSVWQGSAVLVLTGGAGSQDASSLPGRLSWSLGLQGPALLLHLQQSCCIRDELRIRVQPGWSRVRVDVLPGADPALPLGQWPASWLSGLGTPWNTLKLTGVFRVSSPGLSVESVRGRWLFSGRAELALDHIASRVSTLEALGSYQVVIEGDAKGDLATVQLLTRSGPLMLSGSGQWAASRLRFNGQASAAPGAELALNNLLNIIGKRQGALALISIG